LVGVLQLIDQLAEQLHELDECLDGALHYLEVLTDDLVVKLITALALEPAIGEFLGVFVEDVYQRIGRFQETIGAILGRVNV